jgi:methylase of polypeptide subunit release factors
MAKGIIPHPSNEMALHRPVPMVPERDLPVVTAASDPDSIAVRLLEGGSVVIRDAYPTGLKILSHLRERVFGGGKEDVGGGKMDKGDFRAYRNRRAAYRDASSRLLVPVRDNRIALKKAPAIGWLEELYPDVADFLLAYPQVQGLNSSWQWFLKGVRFPVLRHEIYPWYGTYFPTRFDHLHLFDTWLKAYTGSKAHAMDVGTGCGVLAFMMVERGFENVLATDINPNAVMTVRENARHRGVADRIDTGVADVFEGCGGKSGLIVCNPPWLPGEPEETERGVRPDEQKEPGQPEESKITGRAEQPDLSDQTESPEAGPGLMDMAIYYDPDFFERLFSGAARHLDQDGRLVILFSNLGQTEGVQIRHPVEEELANNRRFAKTRMLRQKAKPPSKRTRRRDHRKEEHVELWELALHI